MYEQREIEVYVGQVVETIIDHESIFKKKKHHGEYHDTPEYNPIYKRSVDLLEEMCVHMDSDKFPHKLFRMKAPNENPEEFEYRKSSYQPVTMPFMDRALTTINRIWNESNYTISDWKEYGSVPEGEQPKDYFEKKYPLHKSLISYFRSIVTKGKLKDPNAVRVVKPRSIPVKDDQDGNLIADQTKLLEPVSVIYNSDQVILFEDGEYALIELYEKSMVRVGQKDVPEGKIFEFYDDQNIWRITQTGKKNDWEFQFDVYYNHKLGKLPASKLRGRPTYKENYLIYESHLMPAIPNLNIALYNSNTLEMSITNDAFPQRWEYVDPCNYEGCDSGYILGADDQRYKCPSCQGTGKMAKHSPLGVKQVYVGDTFNKGAEGLSMPPAGYISPEMTTLEFRHRKYISDIEQAFAFLNIDVSNSEVSGQGETALGKKIDREELFSFLLLISNELFDLLDETIEWIGKMRYGLQFVSPSIIRPINFSIRSDDEIVDESIKAREAKSPNVVLRKLNNELISKRFNTDKNTLAIYTLISDIDRLMTLSSEEIIAKKTINVIEDWEVILHDSIETFIAQILIEDPVFLEKDFNEKKKRLEKMAKDKAKQMNKLASADNILAQANGIPTETPVDVEAEAKANLKGSVGGVQGLIQIQTSVAQGITDYEAAVTMLFEIYGFDDSTARKLLGNKQDLENAKLNANPKGNNPAQNAAA